MKRMIYLLSLLCLTSLTLAQSAWWEPAAPRMGDEVTFYYDPRIGTIDPGVATIWMHWGILDQATGDWSTPPESIWPEGSRLHSDQIAVQSPMTEVGDTVWSVTVDFDDATEAIAFVFTDGADQWDNNAGNNWELVFLAEGTVSWWIPEEPEPGDVITIYYDAVAGTLPNNASNVILHWGVNEQGHGNWQLAPEEIRPPGSVVDGVATRTPMNDLGDGLFNLVIATTDSIYSLHYVTTDGSNWDNNNNQNWDIFLDEPPPVVSTHLVFRFDPRSAFAQAFSGDVNSLNLAGTFNGWSTAANPLTDVDPYGNFYGEVEIPEGDLEYKFVINGGNWQIDPDNPRNIGEYNNSLMTVVLDTLPQVYNVSPPENSVFDQGTAVSPTMSLRPGDLGTGIETVSVEVNWQPHNFTWDASAGTLTLDPLTSTEGMRDLCVTLTDSAGRTSGHWIAYGFKPEEGYLAVDPRHDLAYGEYNYNVELHGFTAREYTGHDAILFDFFTGQTSLDETMILFTISADYETWGPVEGLEAELHVPGLSTGGVALLMLDPSSEHFDPNIHNCLHPNGVLSIVGPTVEVVMDETSSMATAIINVDDLEASLGSYQSAWYYSCATLKPGSEAEGYCHEITAADGGTDDVDEPDAYDVMFMMASDLESKMLRNYGLTRRATLDAPGRGIAEIEPSEIGPNIQHEGPLCEVLTRGAPTTQTERNIVGRVTGTAAITEAHLEQNGVSTQVTLNADTFLVSATLIEGPNTFTVWAVDVNSDTGRSASMVYTHIVDHTPDVSLEARVQGNQGFLDASETTDPQGDDLSFLWEADPDNPEPVTLEDANTSVASFDLPATPGEYYFDLTVTDDSENASHGRTFIRKLESAGASPFENDQSAEWVQNAIVYEIFVRSYSPNGDLDGITADIARIADLGVSAIWLMPIFEGPSSHGYEITDYYAIEQDYGTAEDLHELVQACHDHGLKLILDMVLNHTGIGHRFMQDAIRNGHYSHYWDWYDRDPQGNYTYYYDWASLPNINLDNPECAQYWIDMSKWWITEFDIDGYRCDVAWGPHSQNRTPTFWVDWRQQLKEVKPAVMLYGEAAASDFTILTDRFDMAYDWALHHEGQAGFTNMFPSIPNFNSLTDLVTNYGFPWPDYKDPFRFMENHDEARYISIKTPAQTRLVASFLLSIPGIPMLYAGQEIGTTSQRGQIPWGQDPNDMHPFYYGFVNARKVLPAMRTGDFTLIPNSQSGACYSFARTLDGEFPIAFVGNFSSTSQLVSVEIDPELFDIHPDSTYVVTELNTGNSFTETGADLDEIFTSVSSYSSRVWVIADSVIDVSTEPALEAVPTRIALHAAYPNPFNPTTTIPLELSHAVNVQLRIHDILGREVATLIDGRMQPGFHRIAWDGTQAGVAVGSGVYFAVLVADNVHQVRKLVLLK